MNILSVSEYDSGVSTSQSDSLAPASSQFDQTSPTQKLAGILNVDPNDPLVSEFGNLFPGLLPASVSVHRQATRLIFV